LSAKIGLKDIAEHFGVSMTTVSKALNGQKDISEVLRNEIQTYADEIGYIPNLVARNFRQKRTNIIGVVLNNYDNPYNTRMMHGIEEYLTSRGYLPMFMDNHGDSKFEKELLINLNALNAAGILLTPAIQSDDNIEFLRQHKVPFVLVREYYEKDKDVYVTIDDEMVGYMAAKYLCQFDNPRMFFLNGPDTAISSLNRLTGYKKALAEAGVEYNENYVYANCKSSDDGYHIMRKILEDYEPPFSVVCYSDYIAAGTITALQERKINIPFDVAVVGADNIKILSYMKPRLTSLDYPKKRLGEKASELLVELIERNNSEEPPLSQEETRIVFEPFLIIRETG